jgi:hypothetical protein
MPLFPITVFPFLELCCANEDIEINVIESVVRGALSRCMGSAF